MHRFICAEKANHPVATPCWVLGVSRAGFYAAQERPPCQRVQEDKAIAAAIAEIHADSRETYGVPHWFESSRARCFVPAPDRSPR